MASANLISGVYNLSIEEEGKFILTPLTVNNQDSFAPLSQPSSRQFPIIRKPSPHFYTSALGLAGGVGLLVSCVWSILLPAIGSVGVVAFAYLVDRKITRLYARELSPEATKSQNAFTQQLGRGKDSGSLLDESVNTDNLPPPILPMSNVANQPNIPLPPPMPLKQKEESRKTDSTHIGLMKTGTSEDPRNKLLSSIRNSFNFTQIEALVKEDPEKYPSNLLLKELKTTYERALGISKKDWKKYFKNKVDSFEKSFGVAAQGENQDTKYVDMEGICKKASYLDSPLKNMKWIRSLLQVLSKREDLSNEARNHCSEKLGSIGKHIQEISDKTKQPNLKPINTKGHIITAEVQGIIKAASLDLLLKALESVYERGLDISNTENNPLYIKYFKDRLEHFQNQFPTGKDLEMGNISKHIETLTSLKESLELIKGLLNALSSCSDLPKEKKAYFSKKLKYVGRRIEGLGSEEKAAIDAGVASILARRVGMEDSDSESDAEPDMVSDEEWN